MAPIWTVSCVAVSRLAVLRALQRSACTLKGAAGGYVDALRRGFFRKVALALLCLSWIPIALRAQADEYQDAIAKAFAGFKIMARTEFTKEIQKAVKGNPALITGRFNDDELVDFAAIIRSDSKQKSQVSGKEYYRGMYVVCHALDKARHACHTLGTRAIFPPHEWYLYLVESGRLDCYDNNDKKIVQVIKRNAIGTATIEQGLGQVGVVVEIYQPDGSYLRC